jgi:hypothetical protein
LCVLLGAHCGEERPSHTAEIGVTLPAALL